MYGLPRSHVKHSSRECDGRLENALPLSENEARNRRLCRRCAAARALCLICNDSFDTKKLTSCHAVCDECMKEHLRQLSQRPEWDGRIVCPCGSGIVERHLSNAVRQMLRAAKKPPEPPIFKRCPVDIALNDVVTDCCPHCRTTFYDFDGCCAVLCRCGNFFCALCLEPAKSSRECHLHVTECRYNPSKGSYYLSTEDAHVARQNAKCARIVRHLNDVRRESSLLTALVVWKSSHPHMVARTYRYGALGLFIVMCVLGTLFPRILLVGAIVAIRC